MKVIQDACLKYACDCTVRTAAKPPQPIEKSTAGASLLAQAISHRNSESDDLAREVLIQIQPLYDVAAHVFLAGTRRRHRGGNAYLAPDLHGLQMPNPEPLVLMKLQELVNFDNSLADSSEPMNSVSVEVKSVTGGLLIFVERVVTAQASRPLTRLEAAGAASHVPFASGVDTISFTNTDVGGVPADSGLLIRSSLTE